MSGFYKVRESLGCMRRHYSYPRRNLLASEPSLHPAQETAPPIHIHTLSNLCRRTGDAPAPKLWGHTAREDHNASQKGSCRQYYALDISNPCYRVNNHTIRSSLDTRGRYRAVVARRL